MCLHTCIQEFHVSPHRTKSEPAQSSWCTRLLVCKKSHQATLLYLCQLIATWKKQIYLMMLKGAKRQITRDCAVCPGCVEEGNRVKFIFVPGPTTLNPKPHPHFPVPWANTFHGCRKEKTLPSISCERGLNGVENVWRRRGSREKRWSKPAAKSW